MGGSGVIYAGIVVAWAAYFVTWLRRQEPVDTNRSVDRFSSAMRVLSRREAADAESEATTKAGAAAARTAVRPAAPQQPADRDGRRAVYRRRQQVLLLLAVALLGVIGTAAGAAVSWWAVLVPGSLLLGYLLLLRRVSGATERAAPRAGVVRKPAISQPATRGSTDRVLHLGSFRTVSRAVRKALVRNLLAPTARPAQAPRVGGGTLAPPVMPRSARGELAAGSAAAIGEDSPALRADPTAGAVSYNEDPELAESGEGHPPVVPVADPGWEPVPVPLPTYVTAPRAQRVIRTIDLATPGAWTSGRLAAQPRAEHGVEPGAERDDLPAFVGEPTSAGAGAQAPAAGAVQHRRAVGD